MIKPGIFENTIEEVNIKLAKVEAKMFQIDIADGILVDGKSLCEPEQLLKIMPGKNLELHLMVTNPNDYITYAKEVFTTVITQIEANDIETFLETAIDEGLKVGLSINLETPVSLLDEYIQKINLIQFMAIQPGGQGRPFEPKVLEKIKEFKQKHPTVEIQVDGHMNATTIPQLKLLNVDSYIVGSDIFSDVNPQEKYTQLTNLVEDLKK